MDLVINFFVQKEALDNAINTGSGYAIIIVVDYILLLIASIVAVAVIIERFVRLKRQRYLTDEMTDSIVKHMDNGDLEGVIKECQGSDLILAESLATELAAYSAYNLPVEEVAEATAEEVDDRLNANMDILSIVAKVGPLLGLLGTVMGIMYSFHLLDMTGKKDSLSHGITAALDTTVRGLLLGIVCLSMEGVFVRKIENISKQIDVVLTRVVRFLRIRDSGNTENTDIKEIKVAQDAPISDDKETVNETIG